MSLNHLKNFKICEDTFQKSIDQIWTLGDRFGVRIVGAPTVEAKVNYISIGNIVMIQITPFEITIPAVGDFDSIVSTVLTPNEFESKTINADLIYVSNLTTKVTANGTIFNYGLPNQLSIYQQYIQNAIILYPHLDPNATYRIVHNCNFTYLRTQ